MEENSELGKVKAIAKKTKAAKVLKEIKEVKEVNKEVKHEKTIKHKFPEMSENERKLAEADAYLQKLKEKQDRKPI